MADDEKQIEIKKRARRRLVGAAALALLAIIVLPMVMDGEPRPLEQDIQVRIPAQTGDNAIASQIVPRALPAPPPLSEDGPAPAEPQREAQGVAPPPRLEPKSAAASSAGPAAAVPAAKDEHAKAPAKMDEAARAAAILAGKAPDAARATTEYVVQIGAYRDRGNAVGLEGRLKADGFAAFTERVGDKTRVRIGPFADRADAESVLARVRKMGLGGSVMTLK